MMEDNLQSPLSTQEATIQTEAEGLVSSIGPHAEAWLGSSLSMSRVLHTRCMRGYKRQLLANIHQDIVSVTVDRHVEDKKYWGKLKIREQYSLEKQQT